MAFLRGMVVVGLLAGPVAADDGKGPAAGSRVAAEPEAPAISASWPADIRAELERIDGLHRSIVRGGPVEGWRFETVRAGYQAVLKRAGGQPGLEDALRDRLARVSRDEQASRAAREIESILAKGRRVDADVEAVRRNLGRAERARARNFEAVGFIQPSARMIEGRKLFALIGSKGAAIAYLDIPPGINPAPYYVCRSGIRGRVRYSEELRSRLITVRDIVRLEGD
ncbi:hypothetical protein OJF2_39880 [Aquisphaera giovannonii]|uniref:Uncharacterized protein n=1 Tax=Aquisphaera giovannonii TaxID=406548 RepID=A0A5B9W491_9BACT|nr:hypothetical protein [Aquisphaera giovannonii]QEH35436.1 hypothetical protein OJF2_39880 [Aquisphaera giovannonii]